MAADLAVIDQEQAHPMVRSEEEYRVLLHMAQKLLQGGFLPKGVDTPQKVLTIILKGRELGVPPMHALSNIAVINGKPAAGAELLLALVYRAYGGNALRIAVTTRERCLVRYQRPEWPDASELEWTIDDAKDAGLLNNDPWKKYPATMLRWRAISAACKLGFPEVIGGLYTPEELGGRVEINDAGETFIDTASDGDVPALAAFEEEPQQSDEFDRQFLGAWAELTAADKGAPAYETFSRAKKWMIDQFSTANVGRLSREQRMDLAAEFDLLSDEDTGDDTGGEAFEDEPQTLLEGIPF